MSDKSLNQLIESIKTEGIAAAEKKSAEILEKAEKEAQAIIEAAEEKGAQIISNAEKQAQATSVKGEAAFRQAGRDYSIAIRNDILKLYRAALENEVKKALEPNLVKTAILEIIKNVGSQATVKLSPSFTKELADYIHEQLKGDEFAKIVEDQSLHTGFSISHAAEGWAYSITPEEVTSALKSYLNPHWIAILNKENE
ncbi:MAG: hypothetical protein P1U56_06005 [Saprospiraceae bacterium]|nr:hypothetical protein [Saprospiraceae bacterium]